MSGTPGPWYWEKRGYGNIRLFTPLNGSCTVMDFVRMGMQYAQPRFSDRGDRPLGGVMINANKLDLNSHPDARLISAAPDLLEACKAAMKIANEYYVFGLGGFDHEHAQILAAIKLAEGGQQ